ncbi:MAG: 3-oxoacyl-ACP reductase, partial [Rhodobiaceae bacterium]|nr:3-oxoacyl-ACP reductase [Rhodobiaceae bacterium]
LYGNFGQANYGAGKMAQVGMLTTLAIEGPKAGIRVNAVAPVAWTVMTDNLFPPGAKELMPPEAVSPGVLFLASEDAPNGAILNIGGGVYSLSRIVETVPVALGLAHTPDDVAAAYDRIADLSGAVPFDNGPARTIRLFQAAMAAAQSSN